MKYLWIIVLLCLNAHIHAQSPPYEYLKMENRDVLFERVYLIDSLSAGQLNSLLVNELPKASGVKDIKIASDFISAKLETTIDYRKHGMKWSASPPILNHPFFAEVSFNWKDGRYRVICSNMYFNTAGFGKIDMKTFLLKKQSAFDTRPNIIKTGEMIERHLNDLFQFSQKKDW